MKTIGTWMREGDAKWFQLFFDRRNDLRFRNARTEQFAAPEIDGLLLTGGPDISADFLRQPVADPTLIREADPARDAWEFAALESALAAGKPVFAICKGVQLLNVALGGTLRLDIPNHDAPAMKTVNCQPLKYADAARHRYGLVNSSHHQAIDTLGRGLEVEAWCANDDIIEQVRLRDYPWALGVQYHPERDPVYAALFDDFFAQVA